LSVNDRPHGATADRPSGSTHRADPHS
jgi:hypothetical protein